MKGMLSKAFSLALLISVVPSFAALPDVKAAQEAVSPEAAMLIGAVEKVVEVGDKVVESNSLEATAKSAVVSGIVVPSAWEKAKAFASSASDYVANSRVAGYATSAAQSVGGYAHSALVAPFNYTLGYLANKSGLADRVSNIGFVKNDSYYSTTIGKYAFGLAALYAGYRAAKAVYNYATTPADKKALVVSTSSSKAEVAAPVVKSAPRTCKAEKEALFEALTTLYNKAAAGQVLADSKELNALRAFDFLAVNTTRKGRAVSLADGVMSNNIKSYFALISELSSDIDFARTHSTKQANQRVEELNTLCSIIELHFNTQSAATHEKLNFKAQEAAKREASLEKLNAQAKYNPGFITRAYNALVNRYTLGAATVAGLGYAAYKYGVPFNTVLVRAPRQA